MLGLGGEGDPALDYALLGESDTYIKNIIGVARQISMICMFQSQLSLPFSIFPHKPPPSGTSAS